MIRVVKGKVDCASVVLSSTHTSEETPGLQELSSVRIVGRALQML